MNQEDYIKKGWEEQGVDIREEGDHILKLVKDGKVIARFSQTGVEIDNVLKVTKEILAGKYD